MRLSDNERKFLQAINDNCFNTISQIAQACNFNRSMGYHYYRSLYLGGLIEGFELTYAGHKMLQGEELENGDVYSDMNIRIAEVRDKRNP